jgi:tricarballylate dehydrogenase
VLEVRTDPSADRAADVVVVGAGNAALCAALSAAESGAEVLVVERAPKEERGGNSAYTAGGFRVVYDGVDDLKKLIPSLSDAEVELHDFGSYTSHDYFDDMGRLTLYRADPDLVEILVERSFETLSWMHDKGVSFLPMYNRQAYKTDDGGFRFWGGLTVEANGGGPGLIVSLFEAAEGHGVEVWYETRAVDLIDGDEGVAGVEVIKDGRREMIRSGAVVLACGGFEANAEWRARYLGPGWDLARVRGTRYNLGDGIRMALEKGAAPFGHWSGSHAVAWDLNAPVFGDLRVGDGFQKHSYPVGIMVNASGDRFVDEGADFRNYTYVKYGHEILHQTDQFAWQVFDAKVSHLLRDEYRIQSATRVRADTLEELARQLDGVDSEGFLRTVSDFNAAVKTDVPFDPTVLDGRGTVGLPINKTNWANPIDTPPYEAYGVTCGITFTFGGLHIDTDAIVLDTDDRPIEGLFAAGELVGGLFYFNYPGGTGLMSGSVFGRIAGRSAALHANGRVG